jgi:peptidoglycan/LPS O-acetylase OafA/YrhL
MPSAASQASGLSSELLADPARLHGLDALRGVAALCVVGLHTNAVFGGFGWLSKGYLGVDFFLMLSGFLMTRITEPRLIAGLAPTRFMVARYRRFWPMMALGSLIGVPYLWVRAGGDLAAFIPALIANFSLLPWPLANLLFALNIPAWTIFAELVANCAHVFALRRLRTGGLAVLVVVLTGLIVWAAVSYGTLDVGARPSNWIPAVPRVFLAYCLGMLLSRSWKQSPLPALPAPLIMLTIPATLVSAIFWDWRHWSFDLAFVLVLCPLVILAALAITRANPLIRLSAALSFPLFAVHLPILEAMRELGFTKLPALAVVALVTAAIVWWTNRPARRMAQA